MFPLNVSRTTNSSGFSTSEITVEATEEAVSYEYPTPRHIALRLMSGDDVQVGVVSGTYPFRLSGTNDYMVLRLDVEGLKETQTVICGDDTASSLSGTYFDIEDRAGTVRVWYDMVATVASGSITYGVPAVAVAATGSITYGVPVDTDTVIVNGTTLTKVASAPGANEFTDITELEALVEAIALVTSTEDGTTVSITAETAGFAGNSITLALGGGNSGTMAISGATLTGGLESTSVVVNGTTCTYVASAPGANQFSSIAELNTLVTAVASLTSTSDGTTISIVADTAGTAGNSLTLAIGANTAGTLAVSGATLTGGTEASTPPTVTAERLLPVVIAEDATAAAVATATQLALDADAEFVATVSNATVTITDAHTGVRTNIVDTGSTGFTVATTQAGAASPTVYLKSTGTSQVVVAVVPD